MFSTIIVSSSIVCNVEYILLNRLHAVAYMGMKSVALLIFIGVTLSSIAQNTPTATMPATDDEFTSPLLRNPYEITLDNVIAATLQNNLNLKIVEFDKEIADEGLKAEYGIFDPTLFMSYERSESERKNLSGFNLSTITGGSAYETPEVTHETQKKFVTSLAQLLPTGAVLEIMYNISRYQTNNDSSLSINPYYQSGAGVKLRQPLLKDGGIFITKSGIMIARVNKQISRDAFRNSVIDILSRAIRVYWDLVYAIENYNVQKISLTQAQDLLRINKVKYEAGVLPATHVLQAEAQVASRKDQLLLAEKTIFDVSDALKNIMNISRNTEQWQYTLIPGNELDYEKQTIDEQKAYVDALMFRPDYNELKKQKEILEIQKRVAKNQKLPELDLYGSYGFTGTEHDISSSTDELETLDYNNWAVGIELSYPILNIRARHEFNKATLQVEQTQTALENLEQNIRLQVRNAVRQVRTNLNRIPITKTRVDFEQAKLRDELKRYEVGVATIQDVLQFQTDLATARALHYRAIADYLQSLVTLYEATGTLLREYGIMLMGEDA